jgi:hypothetical protein
MSAFKPLSLRERGWGEGSVEAMNHKPKQNLLVPRFWDNQRLQKNEAVLEAILNIARDRTLTPTPLPMGEGL